MVKYTTKSDQFCKLLDIYTMGHYEIIKLMLVKNIFFKDSVLLTLGM